MEISVRGKNLEITPALRQYAEKRVSKIEKFFESAVSAHAVISQERGRYSAEVTVSVNGILLRGEESTGDAFASVDLVVEKLEKQIEKFKTRISRRVRLARKAGAWPEAVVNQEAAEKGEEADRPRVVRVKRFAFKPMSVDEAILQMDLLGHDFFVFTNAETEQVSVVYRRRDGNYGLIEPEY